MSTVTTRCLALTAALLVGLPALKSVQAEDAKTKPKVKAAAKHQTTSDENIPTYSLLEAMNQGLVGVDAEGRGDGRMTLSVTNNTRASFASSFPPV